MTKNVPKVLPKTPHFFANICQLGYFLSKNPYQASIVRDFGHHVRCKGSPNEIDMQYAAYIHRTSYVLHIHSFNWIQ